VKEAHNQKKPADRKSVTPFAKAKDRVTFSAADFGVRRRGLVQ
jgi:hypothetical protein